MRSRDGIGLAFSAVKSQPVRSLLTALGIAVGIAAVVLLTALGTGLQRFVLNEFTQFGTNLLQMTPGRKTTLGLSGAMINSVRPLSLEDAEALATLSHVRAVCPSVFGNVAVEVRRPHAPRPGQRRRSDDARGVAFSGRAGALPAAGRTAQRARLRRARPQAVARAVRRSQCARLGRAHRRRPLPRGRRDGSDGKIVAVDKQGLTRPLVSATHQTLQDIASWDDRHGVAVGNEGVVLITSNGGHSWKTVESVPRSEVANKFTRVRVAADGKAVATGEMGALLISKDYGATWTRLRDEEDVAWNDAALLPDDRLVVVGEFGRILVSPDGGNTWDTPKVPVESSLMAVSFRNANEGVAVGLEGVVLTTRDGGRSWHREKQDSHVGDQWHALLS